MPPRDRDDEIRDVIREERSRGRKPLDTDFERERREREQAIMRVLERRDRQALKEILELYYGPAEVKEKLQLFDSILGPD